MPVASATVSSASGFYPIVGTPGRVTVTYQYDGSAVIDIVSGDGSGDMLTSIYDIDGNGIVDAAESVPWSGITDAPATFPPDSHEHDLSYAPISHAHVESDITDLGSYSVTGHAHTESDISDFGSYAVTGHAHTESDISDFGSYAVTGHAHTESDISDFGSYSVTGHAHTESDISDFGSYAVTGHAHTESDISDLGTYLTEAAADLLYSAIGHTHALADLSNTDMTGITDGYVLTYDTDTWVPAAPVTGVTDHGALSGLTDDDHTQYALLAGRSGGQTLYGGTGSGDDLYIYSTSHGTKGDVVLANGGGRVGIGQAPDAGILQVYAGNSGGTPLDADYVPVSLENDTSLYIQLLTPNTVASGIAFSDPEDWDNAYVSYNHSTQKLTFAADAVETMTLTDGYVGIKTASPYAMLHGHSDTSYDPSLTHDAAASYILEAAGVQLAAGTATASPYAYWLQARASGGAWPLALQPLGGNVGIGTTSPGATVEIYKAAYPGLKLRSDSDFPYIQFYNGGDTADYRSLEMSGNYDGYNFASYYDNGNTRVASIMLVGANGNVGIGTTSPGRKLHVNGSIVIDGDEGGVAGAVTLTDITSGVSTGNGTVKMASGTARDSTGWLKIYVGTTAVYIPYFTTIS